jgi:hypothetical protein
MEPALYRTFHLSTCTRAEIPPSSNTNKDNHGAGRTVLRTPVVSAIPDFDPTNLEQEP